MSFGFIFGVILTGYISLQYYDEIKKQRDVSFLIGQLDTMKLLNDTDLDKKLCIQKKVALANLQELKDFAKERSLKNISGETVLYKKKAQQVIKDYSKYFSKKEYSKCE